MKNEYFDEWVRKAEEDYDVILTLVRKKGRSTPNAIGYHSQQCIEKYLKAFLVWNNKPAPKIHDLLELSQMCHTIHPVFVELNEMLEQLNPYSVEYRYPGSDLSMDEARNAFQLARRARVKIKEIFLALQIQ